MKLSESKIKKVIKETILEFVEDSDREYDEDYYDEEEIEGNMQLDEFQAELDKMFKDKELYVDFLEDGLVSVEDGETGETYEATAPKQEEYVGTGRPNPFDYDVEDEELHVYYDYEQAFNDIVDAITHDINALK